MLSRFRVAVIHKTAIVGDYKFKSVRRSSDGSICTASCYDFLTEIDFQIFRLQFFFVRALW